MRFAPYRERRSLACAVVSPVAASSNPSIREVCNGLRIAYLYADGPRELAAQSGKDPLAAKP
jgi:hypothetical protein